MSDRTILFFLVCIIVFLLAVICCQQMAFRRDIKVRLKAVSDKLSDILERDSDEKVMVFTDQKALMELCGQINRMLLDRQRMRRDYRRKELSIRKMIAVWLFNFAALALSKLLIYGCIHMGSKSMQSSFLVDFHMGGLSFYIQLLLKSAVTVSMSFIALFVGMTMKSSKATIITSFLLIFLTQATIGDFSFAGNLLFPVILTAASFVFAVLSLLHAETKDL